MTNISKGYSSSVAALAEQTRTATLAKATELGASPVAMLTDVIAILQASGIDGRSAGWSARVRLYVADDGYREPIADSDPELSAERPGATVFAALPAIGAWMQELATAHHKAPCSGMEQPTIKKKIAGLRTQLSLTRSDCGTMRVDYFVMKKLYDGTYVEKQCLARVDVQRHVPAAPRAPLRRNVTHTLQTINVEPTDSL